MATTPNLGITLVDQSQSQKEITINEAFARIDAMLNSGAVDISSTPPSSPVAGEVHIVGSSPTGAWAGQANAITYYDQIWRFITPHAGATLWVVSTSQFYMFNGTAWVVSGGGSGTYGTLQTFSVGINVGNSAQTATTTLDWYEEGTFTPTVAGTATAGTASYATRTGTYTRIGDRVDICLFCDWSGHTGTGALSIAGLPFTSNSANYYVPTLWSNSLVVGSGKQLSGLINPGGSVLYLWANDPAGSMATQLPMDATAAVICNATYFL